MSLIMMPSLCHLMVVATMMMMMMELGSWRKGNFSTLNILVYVQNKEFPYSRCTCSINNV